jgi:pyruvate formate lyase activating enzyme
VFDIREFAIHDGPGIRTTVFMKGCPLKCKWCHNPEGISPLPQVLYSLVGKRTVGTLYTPVELAAILNRQTDLLCANGGGVTLSGGEPLMQAPFLVKVLDLLSERLHVVLDTSGYGKEDAFQMLVERIDLVYFDLKLIDSEAHERFTGRDNTLILRNLRMLGGLGVPFVVRVPIVPGVTDTDRNLAQIAQTVGGLNGLLRVDLLPYNRFAGGKYAAIGMQFAPGYDEAGALNLNTSFFEKKSIDVRIA